MNPKEDNDRMRGEALDRCQRMTSGDELASTSPRGVFLWGFEAGWDAALKHQIAPPKPPCRFCGSENVTMVVSDGRAWVRCLHCEATGPTCATEAEALKLWAGGPNG